MIRILNWLSSFTGALFMAVFTFICMGYHMKQGQPGMAWMTGLGTVAWLYLTFRAIKNQDTIEIPLTLEQRQQVREATRHLEDVLNGIAKEQTEKEKPKEKDE